MAHSEIEIATKEPAITARPATSTLKVLVIGALSSIKGYDVLLHCARFAKTHSTPLQFYLMGYSINDKPLEDAGVVITGKYLEPDADYLFSTIAPDAVLLPSIWPETYSYTLSLGLRHGCPIFAFDIGAIPERLKKSDLHNGIMPLEWSNNPEKVINYITACLNNLHQKNYSLN